MSKRFTVVLLLAVFVIGLIVCGGAQGATKAEFIIRFAGSVPEDHPITMGHYKFKELAENYSNGRLEVQVFPNSQLGSLREYHEMLQAGNIQMAEAGSVILANFTKKFMFAQMPFLFNSREAVQHFLAGETGSAVRLAIAEETNIYPLVFYENGFQDVTNSLREIRTPEDMANMKLRTQENPILLEIYKALGANPMPMAFGELFTAMQLKTVDGQVNPILVNSTGRYFEVQKYITDVYAVYDVAGISINYEFYNKLPQDLRDVIHKAVQDALEYHLKLSAELSSTAYDYMAEKGMTVTRLTAADREPFRARTAKVYDWFRAQGLEPNLDQLLAAIEVSNKMFTEGRLEPVIGKEKK